MFCPNCGKSTSAEQKFCRACGLSLEKTVQSLAEQLAADDFDKNLQDKQRKVDRWLKLVAGSAISLITISVIWGIIFELMLVKGKVLTGLVFLFFILGLITFALLVMYRESLGEKSASRLPSQTSPLPQAENNEKLLPESYLESLPSVTERTTELLEVEKKTAQNKSNL
jgi:hypothetical protein